MWVRRSDSEIQELLAEKEIKKRRLMPPILAGLGAGVFAMVVYYFGYRGGSLRLGFAYTTDVGFTSRTVGAGAFTGTILFIFCLFMQRRTGSLSVTNDHLKRCDTCKQISQENPEMRCSCGGTLEPSEYFTWEDDEPRIALG